MKKWSIVFVVLAALVLFSCHPGPPDGGIITDNADKYPFLCPDFQYTIHFKDGLFPSYECCDTYRWDEWVGKKSIRLFTDLGDFKVAYHINDLAAITHVSGSVIEYP